MSEQPIINPTDVSDFSATAATALAAAPVAVEAPATLAAEAPPAPLVSEVAAPTEIPTPEASPAAETAVAEAPAAAPEAPPAEASAVPASEAIIDVATETVTPPAPEVPAEPAQVELTPEQTEMLNKQRQFMVELGAARVNDASQILITLSELRASHIANTYTLTDKETGAVTGQGIVFAFAGDVETVDKLIGAITAVMAPPAAPADDSVIIRV